VSTLVVAGALANKPGNGGETWVRTTWVRGLARLGADAWFVEQLHDGIDRDVAVPWFRAVIADAGLTARAVLVDGTGSVLVAPAASPPVAELAAEAALLVNISGNLREATLLARFRRRAYVDLDPGYTQSWLASDPGALGPVPHHLHFTVGERLGSAGCPLPTGGLPWLPCRQPVLLEDWPVTEVPDDAPFTTVTTWRSPLAPPCIEGVAYQAKHHLMRPLADLPHRVGAQFRLAAALYPEDGADRDRFVAGGWDVVDAVEAVGTPDRFRRFVQASLAECSAAQGVYTAASGWFSDRTVRYLASGRPAVVQDTGFGTWLPTGQGVLTFADVEGAVRAARAVLDDPDGHAAAARALAEHYFAADVVLGAFLERCGVAP